LHHEHLDLAAVMAARKDATDAANLDCGHGRKIDGTATVVCGGGGTSSAAGAQKGEPAELVQDLK
jgi:hypothetical protein